MSVRELQKAVEFTNIDDSNWLQGLGSMDLMLDGVYYSDRYLTTDSGEWLTTDSGEELEID